MGFKTPLHEEHLARKARIVDFAGWDMPVQYESIPAEHQAVRSSAGIFDVSHMGRFHLSGETVGNGLSRLVTTRIDDMVPGQVRYSLVCNEQGGIKDDILITRLGKDKFLLVVNGSNREKLFSWFEGHLRYRDALIDRTGESGMIAIQGPDAAKITGKILHFAPSQLGYYQAMTLESGVAVSRTGYTGEDGFEIITPSDAIVSLWKDALQYGAVPCGLGARDILRLEMGYPLYGHELDEDTSPLEAGLKWAVCFEKNSFVGLSALETELAEGIPRRRIGFQLTGAGIPREQCALYDGDEKIGLSTSGGFSPLLKKGIGLGLVDSQWKPQGELSVEIRGKKHPIEIKKPPFVPKRVKK